MATPDMMCPHCQSRLAAGALFCPFCGAHLFGGAMLRRPSVAQLGLAWVLVAMGAALGFLGPCLVVELQPGPLVEMVFPLVCLAGAIRILIRAAQLMQPRP